MGHRTKLKGHGTENATSRYKSALSCGGMTIPMVYEVTLMLSITISMANTSPFT